MDDHAPGSEWPWNVISRRAVAYSCGAIARDGEAIEHNHDADELALCRTIAKKAAKVMEGVDVGMGSEGAGSFFPFFVAANAGATVPRRLSGRVIREAFGGTIYPPTRIWVEPLAERGDWWSSVTDYYACYEGEKWEARLRPWRRLIAWFHGRSDLHGVAFVMIGDNPLDDAFRNGGCNFPRLALGITGAGSLVGTWSSVVHT